MENQFSRTELIIKNTSFEKIKKSHIAIFGIGGVGGYALEALVRTGIENIDIFDNDTVEQTNLNRQIIALHSTLSMNKVDIAEKRMKDINPDLKINKYNLFIDKETIKNFDFNRYDYIIDAIDTISSKIELIIKAKNSNTPVISSMGTGNKLNPAALEITDIYKTSVCPLARVMRCELKKRGIKNLKVVFSKEQPIKPEISEEKYGRHIPGSAIFVPATAGLIIASEVVKDIINQPD